ncbi:MAG: NAD(P)-dependent oxidoreductase [Bacteroidota bacterium]
MLGKVLFIDKAHPLLETELTKMGFQCEPGWELSKGEVEALLDQYIGLVIRSRFAFDAEFLAKGTNLTFLARTGIGLEHVDLAYAEKAGISVFNSPEGSKYTVGEHALGMLLMLMNHLNRADREVRNGQWIREGNRGTELRGKIVGIVGYGNTGQEFAKRLQGFDVEVLAYDKYKSNYGNAYAKAVSLATIWERSDVVSFHIPYERDNHYLVNTDYLSHFQKPIYLINTARGLILNTADLVDSLKKGRVLGVALDVIEYEETSFAHLDLDQLPEPFQYLRRAQNVVLTPHIAGWSHEAKVGHAQVLVDKIRQKFQGKA